MKNSQKNVLRCTSKLLFPSDLLTPPIDHSYATLHKLSLPTIKRKLPQPSYLVQSKSSFFLPERSNFFRVTAAEVNPWKRLVHAANPISRLVYLTRRLHIGQFAAADVAYKLTAWVPFTNLTRAYVRWTEWDESKRMLPFLLRRFSVRVIKHFHRIIIKLQ